MFSVSGQNWEEVSITKRIIEKVKHDNNFSEILSKLIISRNFDKAEINTINEDVKLTNPFFNNNDFLKSEKILYNALNNKEKIFIIGDYDVDGCVSVSLFVNFFKQLKKNVDYYIPNRFKDGYGASLVLIKKIIKKNPNLIIMVDCGSSSHDAINFLNKHKIKSLIIDHHEINRPYPKSSVLINPKKECEYNKFDYFSAATLSYFLIDFYIKKQKLKTDFDKNLIYVLLSIVCDVMPLRKINRIIAIKVLKDFIIDDNFLIKKFFEYKKINRPFNINDLGFLIGPLLNSAGRLNDANKVVNLLTTDNLLSKENIIKELILANEQRKKIEIESLNQINLDEINKDKNNVLIVCKKNLNEGIIGIIASRLKDHFNLPCIVLTKSGVNYKASARSTSNFNIGHCIKQAIDKKIIINGGGHNLAAGFTIKESKISLFQDFINFMFLKTNKSLKNIFVSKISINAINNGFYNDLNNLGPFGHNNRNPLFLIENVRIIKPKILKDKYVSFFIKSKSGKLIQSICFNLLESELSKNLLYNKNEMSLIVQIKENLWNNKKNLQLTVLDAIHLSNKA